MPYKNIEDRRAWARRYYKGWKDKKHDYYIKHRDEIRRKQKEQYQRRKGTPLWEKRKMQRRERRRKDRIVMLLELGGKCIRCGYHKYISALEIHHIYGRETKGQCTKDVRLWIKTGEFPKDVELLCACCHAEEHQHWDKNKKRKEEFKKNKGLS